MRAACDGIQRQLYNLHASSSATAWRRRRLSPEGRLVYAAYLGDVGVAESKELAVVFGNIAEAAIAIAIPGESDLRIIPPNASGGIP